MGGYLVENVLRLMGGSLEKIDKNGRILSWVVQARGRELGTTWCTHLRSTYRWPALTPRFWIPCQTIWILIFGQCECKTGFLPHGHHVRLQRDQQDWLWPVHHQGREVRQFIIFAWIYQIKSLLFSGCLKCMIIYQKHFNVLQYRESECNGNTW